MNTPLDAYDAYGTLATEWGFRIIAQFPYETANTSAYPVPEVIDANFFRLNDPEEEVMLYRENNGREGFCNAARRIEYWVFDPEQPMFVPEPIVVRDEPDRHWSTMRLTQRPYDEGSIYLDSVPTGIILVKVTEIDANQSNGDSRSVYRLHFPVTPR